MDLKLNNSFIQHPQDFVSHGQGHAQQWCSLGQQAPPSDQMYSFADGQSSILTTTMTAMDEILSDTSISPQQLQFDTSSAERASSANTSASSLSSPGQYKPLAMKGTSAKQTAKKIDSAEAAAASDRSERARNAANRRHSRAKETTTAKAPDEKRSRQEIEREKNRVAAAKCRRKKRVATDALDAEYRSLSASNARMKRDHRELRDQLTYWRMLALQHVNGQNGCQCHAVQRYNNDQAFRAVYDMESNRSMRMMDDKQIAEQDALA